MRYGLLALALLCVTLRAEDSISVSSAPDKPDELVIVIRLNISKEKADLKKERQKSKDGAEDNKAETKRAFDGVVLSKAGTVLNRAYTAVMRADKDLEAEAAAEKAKVDAALEQVKRSRVSIPDPDK